ncbi:NAD(P)H-dependent flavin oxidoreductase [Methylovorus mays]|uniref:NAD(P)H-dependent flavin oxidoreductase n=1 Tax=Methylovorus mays TaxID=184077 RepID=UPI001E395DB4|nr:nitronate monooxygenase [Methylovorus mays]MCB5206810.1 nitronate monooxygenase [Methylovorus mays]
MHLKHVQSKEESIVLNIEKPLVKKINNSVLSDGLIFSVSTWRSLSFKDHRLSEAPNFLLLLNLHWNVAMHINRICKILGIEKPVIQAPLSWLTDARLVAAVGNAGGLGVLGPNAGLTAETAVSTPEETAEKMRDEIRKTKALTDKPFGVNLIPMAENDIWTPHILKVMKEEGVKATLYTGYGEGAVIPKLFDELKEAGIKIIYRDLNPTPENTRLAENAGADIIVATGFDEGGTLPGTALGTFSIVPLIVDAARDVPVLAAGGISDKRTARAAHALGASGVSVGSAFISTVESRVPQSVKDKIVSSNGLDLLLFRTMPDYYRSLPGKLAHKLVELDKAGASNEDLGKLMGGLRGLRIGMLEGNTDDGYISLGTGIGNIRRIKTVAEVVDELAI